MTDLTREGSITEADIEAAVRLALQRGFPVLHGDALEVECVRESIVAELADLGVPDSEEKIPKDTIAEYFVGNEKFGMDEEDIPGFFKVLWEQFEALRKTEDDELLDDGVCQLCERPMALTRHHLIPRTTWDWYAKRHGGTKELMAKVTLICRPCHSAVHSFHDEKTLAVEYNTVEKLLALEEIQKFIKWVRSQPIRTKQDSLNKNIRYRK
eukprot:TRINITY_DN66951_c3_g1_i1.p1 TRINITY_DN66951_c3_g1~~TRINITY_DN66951_c3_g1_i1.p1  ORF type:complete len:234 (-),score=27.53 TRINITY_DN66951_c3_g1_i1:116-748(-)